MNNAISPASSGKANIQVYVPVVEQNKLIQEHAKKVIGFLDLLKRAQLYQTYKKPTNTSPENLDIVIGEFWVENYSEFYVDFGDGNRLSFPQPYQGGLSEAITKKYYQSAELYFLQKLSPQSGSFSEAEKRVLKRYTKFFFDNPTKSATHTEFTGFFQGFPEGGVDSEFGKKLSSLQIHEYIKTKLPIPNMSTEELLKEQDKYVQMAARVAAVMGNTTRMLNEIMDPSKMNLWRKTKRFLYPKGYIGSASIDGREDLQSGKKGAYVASVTIRGVDRSELRLVSDDVTKGKKELVIQILKEAGFVRRETEVKLRHSMRYDEASAVYSSLSTRFGAIQGCSILLQHCRDTGGTIEDLRAISERMIDDKKTLLSTEEFENKKSNFNLLFSTIEGKIGKNMVEVLRKIVQFSFSIPHKPINAQEGSFEYDSLMLERLGNMGDLIGWLLPYSLDMQLTFDVTQKSYFYVITGTAFTFAFNAKPVDAFQPDTGEIDIHKPEFIALPPEISIQNLKTLFDIYAYCKDKPTDDQMQQKIKNYMNIWKDIPPSIQKTNILLLNITKELVNKYGEKNNTDFEKLPGIDSYIGTIVSLYRSKEYSQYNTLDIVMRIGNKILNDDLMKFLQKNNVHANKNLTPPDKGKNTGLREDFGANMLQFANYLWGYGAQPANLASKYNELKENVMSPKVSGEYIHFLFFDFVIEFICDSFARSFVR